MADKASRGLVIYGDGLMPLISPSHTHLHQLASRGTCGFLSLPHSPPSESDDERVVRELAQLLDAYDSYNIRAAKQSSTSESLVQTISERFMGLRAAIFTNDSSVRSFASLLGLTVLQFDELIMNNNSPREPAVSGLLKLLGFQGCMALDTCEFDLVFVHIKSGGRCSDLKVDIAGGEVEFINGLIGGILEVAQLGSEISTRLHISLVISYGTLAEDKDSVLNLSLQEKANPDLSLLFPRQSYITTGKNSADSIRHHCPMLISQWQEAVTRKDTTEIFTFKEFKEHGANLAIPADRFLHEVAFKLWKAPKYGA
ncbi:hypothetical protein IFM89_030912 [Coptis chinensis]|uniref:AT5G11810-like protein n=1 Tax=Coptis chinensis TaxID=261450 RepID=A0A835LX72_9MAGN|nr:hypothetical protein IFM89_030912 [Coptis chinensis]